MTRINRSTQSGSGTTFTVTLLLFIALVAAGVWAVYTYGDGHIVINDRTLDDLQPWEVVLGVVIGIIGAIIGILAGLVGVIIGLVAAFLSIVMALLGVAAGLFIFAGVLAGPVLLLAGIIILMTRSKRQQATGADDTNPMIESSAEA